MYHKCENVIFACSLNHRVITFDVSAPSQPTNLAAATLNATAVTITWDLPATPNGLITRYEIHYNTAEKSDVTSKMLLANQLSVLQASIDSLKPFTRYQFKVRAATEERNVMWGNFSAITEATTGEAGKCIFGS